MTETQTSTEAPREAPDDASADAPPETPVTSARPFPTGPIIVLGLAMLVYVFVFGTLTWRQQSRFATFGFDMGIYDQGIWLVSRFKEPFVTVRGLNYFGHHVNLITVLFVPAYWLGAGPHFLYLVETLWLAAAAIPVYLLGRYYLESAWLAVSIAVAYLLHPAVQWINWWHFHPDALIILPLLFAYWLALTGRWRWFALAVAVTLACKEDAAMAVFVLGLIVAWKHNRRVGLITAGAAVAWFLIATRVIIPRANAGVGPFYEDFFPGFGNSMSEIAWNVVRHPSRVWRLAAEESRVIYYRKLLTPVALLAILGAPGVLIALPQLAVNVASGHAGLHDIRYHYSAVVVAGIFIGVVQAIHHLAGRRSWLRHVLCAGVLGAAVATNIAWSPSPIGAEYDNGTWAKASPAHARLEHAVKLVPDGAGVSATYYLVPHLTQRERIYEWPNPWDQVYWAVRGENPHPPSGVDYLVLDTRLIGQDYQALFDSLTAPGGEFQIVSQAPDLVVARRVRPPANSPS